MSCFDMRVGCQARVSSPRIVAATCTKKRKFNAIPLPGWSGYMLPPIATEKGFLYGPGMLGFKMKKNLKPKGNIIKYQQPPPPVVLDHEGTPVEVVIVDDAELVDDRGQTNGDEQASARPLLSGAAPIAGMLPPAPPRENEENIDAENNQAADPEENLYIHKQGSPRRTLRISFTCNRCGARNVHSVNPQAWETGTVFVQCGGCSIKHKIVDHLNLLHDYGSGITLDMARALERQRIIRELMPEQLKTGYPEQEDWR